MATGDLVDRLVRLGDRSPERLLYVELLDGATESATLTAGELVARSAAVAAGLRAQGVGRGDVALHIATAPADFLVGLFGCLWAGVIAAPVAFPRRPEHLASRLEPVRQNAGATAVVAGTPQNGAEAEVLALLAGGDLPVVPVSGGCDGWVSPVRDRDVAYLQYTSGSTSVPKGVIVTHENLMANLAECTALLGYGRDMVTVSWCPLTHDMGLVMGALPSVHNGSTTVLMPPSTFIRRPLAWLRAIDRYRGTHTYSPNFGYDLCVERSEPEDRAGLDLSSMRVWLNGAEPVRPQTRERFLAAFGPCGVRPRSYTPAWGLAEATVLVSATPPTSPGAVVWVDAAAIERDVVVVQRAGADGARPLCADGIPGPGYEIRIVDPVSFEPAPLFTVGEVWVRGPSVSPGYWRRPDASAATFGHTITGEKLGAGSWMRTGDLGFWFDGEVIICGRAKDVIIVNGRNLHPQDIELTVEECHPAVRLGGSAAFAISDDGTEVLVVLAEVDDDSDVDLDEVRRTIVAAVLVDFEVRVADVLLVGPREVPKTSSGKKQRSVARELWRRSKQTAMA